jgi:hypothetical protein
MLGDGSKSSKDLVASVEKNGGGNYVDAVDENGRFIVLKSERNASLRVEKGDLYGYLATLEQIYPFSNGYCS